MLTTTSPELKTVETALKHLESSLAEQARLCTLQTELSAKIESAVRTGDPDDADFVQRIGMDRTRLEMLPAKITHADNAARAAQEQLFEALKPASQALAQAGADAHAAARAKLTATLRDLLTDEGVVLKMVDMGAPFSKSARRPAILAATFSATALYERKSEVSSLVDLARHLLSEIKAGASAAS